MSTPTISCEKSGSALAFSSQGVIDALPQQELSCPTKHHSPITIRRAGPQDHATLVQFSRELARETEDGKELPYDNVDAGIQVLSTDPNGRILVACEGDLIGEVMIGGVEISEWKGGSRWWLLTSAFVRPDKRGQGVLQALYQTVKQQALETPGVCGIRLCVRRSNLDAQAVWKELGFCFSEYLLMEDWWGA